MLNRIVLIGRLTRDPESKYTQSGTTVAHFSLAVDRQFKSADGERETDFIDIVAWSKTAEFVNQYATKGRLTAVEGRLQVRKWTAQDGSRRTSYEVNADNVQFLDRPRDGGHAGAAPDDEGAFTGAARPAASDEMDTRDPFADE